MGEPFVEREVVPTIQAQRDANCALGLPSVRKEGLRDKRVAIIGFGPSLEDTWPLLLDRKYDAIVTVSKAHDFLIERGVIPTHHVDTDWREHKVSFNRMFQQSVKYVLATQVHPTYPKVLTGRDVSLFHVVQPQGGLYDPRYFKSPVMFDAGLQAARLWYELGYREQEWLGMDASARKEQTHAGPHEGLKPPPMQFEVAGRLYTMSPFLVRQALFCERMLCKLPHLRVTIFGDGALRPMLLERGKCKVS
jgi:hypothetical protein